MKKLILSAALVVLAPAAVFADAPAPQYALQTEPYSEVSLMSIENSLDFSLLDGVFTVEVAGDIPDTAQLIVGEYSSDGRIVGAQITDTISQKNSFNVSGDYEKAFLWNKETLDPLAKSITTQCDYEIIEGTAGEWETSADGHTLYNYIGENSDVIIPNSYMGKRIYMLQNEPAINNMTSSALADLYKCNIFNARQDITSVKIPDGIKAVGSLAFAGSENITGELYIPKECKIVYNYAFYGCKGFVGDLDISKVALLGVGAFMRCERLNGELSLPPVSEIPMDCFADCVGFSCPLNIPEGVETLGQGAFAKYSAKTNGKFSALYLPSTLKEIGAVQFQYQTGFKNELILPDGLEYIGDLAFNHCTGFSNTSLTIPKGVKTIGGDLNVEKNTGWGGHVFYDSFKKTTEFIADGEYFTAGDGVLYSKDMTRLLAYPSAKTDTEFALAEGIVQLDEMSLANSKIKTLTLPDSYIMSEDVPENILNNMANNLAVAFYHYNSIENISVKDTNENYTSADGILYSKDMKELWYVPTKKTGTIEVAEGTQTIHKGAFYIENAIKSAEQYTEVKIPASVTYINPYTVSALNIRAKSEAYPLKITVDENNTKYETDQNGCLTQKTE
ncbi:MAG: leucine-rich repeat protein [Clostridiales bacterium]|nr:leucine-rich repeat protein [Clostridiales bacterium]